MAGLYIFSKMAYTIENRRSGNIKLSITHNTCTTQVYTIRVNTYSTWKCFTNSTLYERWTLILNY